MKKIFASSIVGASVVVLSACSSSAPEREVPAWINEPTRIVDNGYIVYTGTAEEVGLNEANLAAEGMALQDLANECSFIPKGTRVEDHYDDKQKNTYKAYAKIAVEVQVCDEASKKNDPVQIKELASLPFTEELQRFQASQDHRDEVADSGIPSDQLSAPANGGGSAISSHTSFFIARQYVVYQNQAVIMAPPATYAPGTPAYVAYTNNVRPVIGHVNSYATQNPELRTNPPTWSHMAPQIHNSNPQAFKPSSNPSIHPPSHGGHGGQRPHQNQNQPRRRKHYR